MRNYFGIVSLTIWKCFLTKGLKHRHLQNLLSISVITFAFDFKRVLSFKNIPDSQKNSKKISDRGLTMLQDTFPHVEELNTVQKNSYRDKNNLFFFDEIDSTMNKVYTTTYFLLFKTINLI